MRILKSLIFGSLLVAGAAHAEFLDRVDLKPALVSGFVSKHLETKKTFKGKPYNEDNYGIGYRFGGSDIIVGYYKNSEHQDSLYAAYEARWKLTDNFQVGVLAGAVSGYERGIVPLLLPEVVVQVGGFELAASYIPKLADMPPVTAIQARWGW